MSFAGTRLLGLACALLLLAAVRPAWAVFGDCPPVGSLDNFEASAPPQTRTYDAQDFRVMDGNDEKTVVKTGALCLQHYALKQGLPAMSGLEIMRNYAEGLPAMGATITNPKRSGDDDVYATLTANGAEYWIKVSESGGNGLHIMTIRTVAFKPSLAALTDKDCTPVPALDNFAAPNPQQTRTYDAYEFRVMDGNDEKTVAKAGAFCLQHYSLKPGVGVMSGLEIMQNYAEGLPAMGATITNPKRSGDDDVYATFSKDGADYWIKVSESGGDGLHIMTIRTAAFKPSLAALTDKDCAPVPALEDFTAPNPQQTRTYDAYEFRVMDGNDEKTVAKAGAFCLQHYSLRPGVGVMSGLEIMQNYAEGLPAMGATITNPKRSGDDDVYATLSKDGADYWIKVSESGGDGLHIMTIRTAAFKSSLAALADKDCPPVPALENFAAANPPETKQYDSRDFVVTDGGEQKTVSKTGQVCGQNYRLKPGVVTMSGLEIMQNYAEGLPAAGMTITNPKRSNDDDVYATMTKDGTEYWIKVSESGGDGLHTMVLKIAPFHSSLKLAQTGDQAPPAAAPPPAAPVPPPPPAALTLPAPAATPEKIVPDQGDFPYLPPIPGSRLTGGHADPAPFTVQPSDAKQPEMVANGSIVKQYQAPTGMTAAQLIGLYRDALLQAHWTIVTVSPGDAASLTAHYGQNGRNIWALLRLGDGSYVIAVADATLLASQLTADLAARCHLALTGVLFDFDKSTLKPESDAILERVGAMMTAAPSLKLEVQGHTDGKGGDAYNQRLSEARARSVVTWLTQRGVAPDHLTARGYGKTRPVASNDTDEGRARNRRVEIANPACRAN